MLKVLFLSMVWKGAVGIRAKVFRCKKQKCLSLKGTVKVVVRSAVYNTVGTVTRLPPGRSEVRNPAGSSDFLFSEPPRPALVSTHSGMKWIPVQSCLNVRLIAYVNLVPRLRIGGGLPPLFLCAFLAITGTIYLYLFNRGLNQDILIEDAESK